jgi:hypothetical protein
MKTYVAGFGQEIFIRNYITPAKPERRALKEA